MYTGIKKRKLLPDNTDCMVINDDSEQYSIMKFSIENA